PPVRSKGRTRQRYSPHTGGRPDAFDRSEPAPAGQGKVARRVRHELTSYSGLELLRRYLRRYEVPRRLRAACVTTGGDYGGGRLALLILALFYVGARRLEHLRYLGSDPLIARFCGLARLPTARTVGNWLREFTQSRLGPLIALNRELVIETVKRLA